MVFWLQNFKFRNHILTLMNHLFKIAITDAAVIAFVIPIVFSNDIDFLVIVLSEIINKNGMTVLVVNHIKWNSNLFEFHKCFGAGDGTRTRTGPLPADFKSAAAAITPLPQFNLRYSPLTR